MIGRTTRPALSCVACIAIGVALGTPRPAAAQSRPAAAPTDTKPSSPTTRPTPPAGAKAPALLLRPIKARIESERPLLAIAAIERLFPRFETDARVHALLGEAHYALGSMEVAVASFERAIALDPRLRSSLYHLGLCYQALDRYVEAAKVFQAMEEDPRPRVQAKGAFGLGLNELLRGEDAAADGRFLKAIELDPTSPLPRYRRALLQIEREEFDGALQELVRVLRLDPLHYGASFNLALALSRLGRTEEAESALERSNQLQSGKERIAALQVQLRENPRQATLLVELGKVHAELGAHHKAIRWFQDALRQLPRTSPRVIDSALGLAQGLRSIGREHDAEGIYRQLVRRDPPVMAALAPLLEILDAHGHTAEAKALRERFELGDERHPPEDPPGDDGQDEVDHRDSRPTAVHGGVLVRGGIATEVS